MSNLETKVENKVNTEINVDALKKQVKDLNSLIKAVTPTKIITQTVVDRKNLNTMCKNDLMSFSQVFKFVRSTLLQLPNKVTNASIAKVESEIFEKPINEVLFIYATESLKDQLKSDAKSFDKDRLTALLTNVEKFAKVCLTPKQYIAFKAGQKSYNGTFVVDALLKGCTMNAKLYNELLKK